MKQQIAEALLEIGAVFLRPNEPFTWASGIQSPIYCDNRLILTAPKVRSLVAQAIGATIKGKFPDCVLLMGTATAGIAHAAIAAHMLDLPMGYVRSGAKDHGRSNQIEGSIHKGQHVVIVEDLISTGGSVIAAASALKEAELCVDGAVCIFTYQMEQGKIAMDEAKLPYESLTDFDTLVEVAVLKNYITENDKVKLFAFRDDPRNNAWQKG